MSGSKSMEPPSGRCKRPSDGRWRRGCAPAFDCRWPDCGALLMTVSRSGGAEPRRPALSKEAARGRPALAEAKKGSDEYAAALLVAAAAEVAAITSEALLSGV